jgi:hypothetical protein
MAPKFQLIDLAGNPVQCVSSVVLCFSFTTGNSASSVGPAVTSATPADQQAGVPISTQIVVRFDKIVNPLTLNQVVLSTAGVPVPVIRSLSNGGITLTLVPIVPLDAETVYTFSVAGVQDMSGNAQATAVTHSFTTGAGAAP